MKIQKIFHLLAVILCVGFVTSCEDDKCVDKEADGKPAPSFTSKISSSVYGFVTDENEEPMTGATVKAGDLTATTDENGYFSIENAQVVKSAGVVTAEKNGYFRGIRSWVSESGQKQFVRIKLLPKTRAGSFSSEAGGNVALSNGLKLTFPESAIIEEEAGTDYTGTVNVAMQWINPVSPYLSEMMPGDLRALNEEGRMQGLITYGMVAVELTSPEGKILQLADGKTAELRTPIESELQANAPSEMPSWSFDEEKGFWIEEGTLTRSGNEYVGQVSHFSFWNADVPYNFVFLKCRFVDTDGKPMAGYTVSISSNEFNYAYSYTDADGYVSGYVPKAADLTMYIYSAANRDCHIYSKKFSTGTASRDIDLGTITVSDANVKIAKVKGTLLACDGSAVKQGYLNYSIDTANHRVEVTEGGAYEFKVYFCEDLATLEMKAYDTENIMMKSAQHTLINGENNIDPIMVCDEIEGSYVIFYIDNEAHIIDFVTAHYWDNATGIYAFTSNESKNINIDWKGGLLQTGEFDFNYFHANFWLSNNSVSVEEYFIETDDQTTGKVTVTEYKRTSTSPNKYTIRGSFDLKNALRGERLPTKSDPVRKDVSGNFYMENGDIHSNDTIVR